MQAVRTWVRLQVLFVAERGSARHQLAARHPLAIRDVTAIDGAQERAFLG